VKNLLRSTFIARPDDDPTLFYRNVQALTDSGLGFEGVIEDEVIWKYIQNFVQQHHHVPEVTTLKEHFTVIAEEEVLKRLDVITLLPNKTRGNFLSFLEGKVEATRVRVVAEILREAARIVETGVTIKDGKEDKILKGPVQAIQYVLNRGHEIVMPSLGLRLSGNVTKDGESFRAEYERVEKDPLAGIGQFCGITQIDDAVRGAKRGELWTHAAFTGGLKSTFAMSWAYNQSVFYKHSCAYFSLEMPYLQDRRLIYAMHSAHPKFKDIRAKLGLGKCLAYQRIRDGELDCYTDDEVKAMPPAKQKLLLKDAQMVRRVNPLRPERTFMMDHVIPDFNDPKNNYGNIHIEVADPDKSDYTVADLRSRAELLYSNDLDIQTIFVDHMGLMSPRHRHHSTTENLNEVLRDLKRMALGFNRGTGIAVVGLFQISREGYKAAEKSDGRYNLTHLSYANEAERSSDIVTTTFLNDELRQGGLARFQCLKSRDNQPFDTFYGGVLWPCRYVFTTHDVTPADAKKAGESIDLDKVIPEG